MGEKIPSCLDYVCWVAHLGFSDFIKGSFWYMESNNPGQGWSYLQETVSDWVVSWVWGQENTSFARKGGYKKGSFHMSHMLGFPYKNWEHYEAWELRRNSSPIAVARLQQSHPEHPGPSRDILHHCATGRLFWESLVIAFFCKDSECTTYHLAGKSKGYRHHHTLVPISWLSSHSAAMGSLPQSLVWLLIEDLIICKIKFMFKYHQFHKYTCLFPYKLNFFYCEIFSHVK